MASAIRMAAIFVFLITCLGVCAGCSVDDVAVYKVVFKGLWSEERFPKDYPLFRPKAQWSQLFVRLPCDPPTHQWDGVIIQSDEIPIPQEIGQSHNTSYTLYRLGEVAKESVQKFSQFGQTADLVEEGDEDSRVYDQFSAPPVGKGVGETENMVFVDGEHSLMSAMCRIIPSPDWFVGVDSLNLCVDSTWIEQVTLELEPLDAGAASGLTFTAPRWETRPAEPVAKHGPRSPNHAAAGFYYPELKGLPAIARLEITKVKEYTIKELNDITRKELLKNIKQKPIEEDTSKERTFKKGDFDEEEEMTTKNSLKNLMDSEEDSIGETKADDPDNIVEVVTRASTTTTTTTEAEFDPDLHNMDEVVLAVANGRKLGLGKHLPRHFRSRLHHAVNKLTEKDCLVSKWSDWTPCSKTCGFGDKFRSREIIRPAAVDGRACPELVERTHCGNVNSCYHVDYFNW